MALDFPTNPTTGQQYSGYVFDGIKWKVTSTSTAPASIGTTAPVSASIGDMWWNSNDGTQYLYYNDGNTSQWVESRSAIISDGYYSPNYFINGAFDIAQRGTASAPGSGEAYGPDRWVGSGVTSVTQTAFGTSDPSPLPGVGYFARILRSSNVGNYPSLAQRIEDVRTLSGQTVTFSFYARTTSAFNAGTWYSMFYQGTGTGGGTGGANYTQTAFTATSTWQRFTFTYTLPSINGITIGANNFLAVGIRNDSATATAGQLDITGMQLETGSVATPFRRNANSLQGELAACQRYYCRTTGTGAWYASGITFVDMEDVSMGGTTWPVQMRATPTVVLDSGGANTVRSYGAYADVTVGTYYADASGIRGITHSGTYTVGRPYSGKFTASAEL